MARVDLPHHALGRDAHDAIARALERAIAPHIGALPRRVIPAERLRAKYIAEGRAEALLDLLAARDFVVTDAQRRAVLACTDEALLKRWFVAALTATSTDEILAVV